MATAFASDEAAPALNSAITSETVASPPGQDVVNGNPPSHPLTADPPQREATHPTDTSSSDLPGQNDLPGQVADVPSSGDAAVAHGHDVAGGAGELSADHTLAHTSQRPPAADVDEGSSTTPGPTGSARHRANVLEQILHECEVPAKVGDLAHAGSLIDVRRGTGNPAGLLSKLRAGFSDQELRDAGLLVSDELANNCLHPDVAVPTQLWLALRDSNGTVYEIVGESGGLRTQQPVAASIQWDQTFREAAQATGIAVVVFSISDMVLLRSWGVAALMATDLARVPIDPAERTNFVRDRDYLDKEKNQFPENDVQYVLLAAWSIATQDPAEPPGLEAVKDHFRLRKHLLGFHKAEVLVWLPAPQDQIALRWLFGRGNTDGIAKLFEDAFDSAQPLIEPPPPRPPKTMAENLEAWVLSPEFDSLVEGKLERNLSKQHYDTFIAPLFDAAADCPDPAEATLKQIFALRSCDLQRRSLKRLRDPQSEPSKTETAVEHQQLQDLLQIQKALQAADTPPRSSPRTIILPGKASPVPHLPSYKRSDQP